MAAEPLQLADPGGVRQPQHRRGRELDRAPHGRRAAARRRRWRCIARRPRAAGATPSSTRRCTTRRSNCLRLETELRRAVERREFRSATSRSSASCHRQVAGFEALVRWQHPERGLLAPSSFLPARRGDRPDHADRRVDAGEACRQAQAWQRARPAAQRPTLSVNLSAKSLGVRRRSGGRVAGVLAHLPVCRRRRCASRSPRARRSPTRCGPCQCCRTFAPLGVRVSPRRLRHRLLLAELPAAVPGGHAQDRPLLRRRIGEQGEGDEIVRLIVRPGADARHRGRRRGDRDGRAGGLPGRLGCGYAQGFYFSRPWIRRRSRSRGQARLRRASTSSTDGGAAGSW